MDSWGAVSGGRVASVVKEMDSSDSCRFIFNS